MAVGRQFGPYTLTRKLARGGMADIYLATRRTADGKQLCVIKMMLPSRLRDPRSLKLFLGEARLAAQLDHPNIARLHLLDRADDYYFISMEYIPGETLYHLLHQATHIRRPIQPLEASSIVHQACSGLAYAHAATDAAGNPLHLVHRDISPSNLMLSYDGVLKILDFGIAAARTRTAGFAEGKAFGKFGYMSPEQCRGRELDQRSDIFSLGVVYWELATGGALFPGRDPDVTMAAILAGDIPPPTSTNAKVTGAEEQVIMKALALDPKNRFQDARQMAAAIEEARFDQLLPPSRLADMMGEFYGRDQAQRAREGDVGQEISLATLLFDDLDAEPPSRQEAAAPRVARLHLPSTTWALLVLSVLLLAGALVFHFWVADTGPHPRRQSGAVQPRADFGSILVDSSPRGARVFVRGQDTGLHTPAKVRSVPLAEYVEITLAKKGFEEWSGRVLLESREPRRISAVLVRKGTRGKGGR